MAAEVTKQRAGRDVTFVAVALAALVGCGEGQPGNTAAPTDHATLAFPAPADASSCDELLAQIQQLRRDELEAITDLDDVMVLGSDRDAKASEERIRYDTDVAQRDQDLECRFMQDPPSEFLGPPSVEPVNKAQEMRLADTSVLAVALGATVEAMADYRAQHGVYPSTIDELRTETSLNEPLGDTTVEIVSSTVDSACIRGETADAPYPVHVSVPDLERTFEPC